MSDRISKFIQTEIDQINSHLPQKVISLRIVQNMEKPGVKSRDGTFYEFNQEEIEKMKQLVPSRFWGQVLLPIIITRRRDLGAGAYTVGGSDANLYIIQSIFDELPSYEIWKASKNEYKTFYKPHIRDIRKEYESTTVIAFS